MSVGTDDLRIGSITELMEPQALIEEMPPSAAAVATVSDARQAMPVFCAATTTVWWRWLACSIHDTMPR